MLLACSVREQKVGLFAHGGSMAELAIKQNESDALEAPFEEGEVQAGNPLPIGGAHQYGDGVNFVLFSRHATGVRLELYQNAGDSSPAKIMIWVRRVIAPVMSGMCGCGGFPRVNSMAIALKGPINQNKAIASTHINCFWIRMQEQSQGSRIGIFWPPAATIRLAP